MRTKFIAEISANHQGDIKRAYDLIDAAQQAGADYVKFQTWKPGTMAIPGYKTEWQGKQTDLQTLYEQAHTPWEWHKPLFDYARKLGIEPISSPFDKDSVDFLESLDCEMYKIASFELIDIPLIRYAASMGKPMLMSTGMANRSEIRAAVNAASESPSITLLLCTSSYPAEHKDMNLNRFFALNDIAPGCSLGLSDHSLGFDVAVMATPMVEYIEKHLVLDRNDGSLDAHFSMEPNEFEDMIIACRYAEEIMGDPFVGEIQDEKRKLRRSVYFARNLKAGTEITEDHIKTARPALGLSPVYFETIIGKVLTEAVSNNQPVEWKCFE